MVPPNASDAPAPGKARLEVCLAAVLFSTGGAAIKLTSLIVNKFALYLIGACAIFAVIRLTFGS